MTFRTSVGKAPGHERFGEIQTKREAPRAVSLKTAPPFVETFTSGNEQRFPGWRSKKVKD